MERVTLYCFALSYAAALGLELWHLYRRRPVHQLAANLFGAAGLLAQTIFLAVQRPPLAWQFGLLLVLAWILAVFYLFGAVHHTRQAWGIFVLPVLLVLVGLAFVVEPSKEDYQRRLSSYHEQEAQLLALVHRYLLVLGAVGVCVGFVASIMYL